MRHGKTLLITAVFVACIPVWAGEQLLRFDPETTDVSFFVNATGHDFHGSLVLKEGQIRFDPQTGEASGKITIDARRAETGNKKRDKKMHHKVLESEQYPLFRFVPTHIEGQLADSGTSEVTLHGTLSIRGDEHPLVLPTTVEMTDGHLKANTTFPIPYVEWGMHNPSMLILRVAKVVEVTISTEGTLTDARGPAQASLAN